MSEAGIKRMSRAFGDAMKRQAEVAREIARTRRRELSGFAKKELINRIIHLEGERNDLHNRIERLLQRLSVAEHREDMGR